MCDSRIVVRIIADLPNGDSARGFAGKVASLIEMAGQTSELGVRPYWKIPEFFEVTFALNPRKDIKAAFADLLGQLGQGWKMIQSSDQEGFAVWNHGDGEFFDSRVEWASVEYFPQCGRK